LLNKQKIKQKVTIGNMQQLIDVTAVVRMIPHQLLIINQKYFNFALKRLNLYVLNGEKFIRYAHRFELYTSFTPNEKGLSI